MTPTTPLERMPELPLGIRELATAAENARMRYETMGLMPLAVDAAERAIQRAQFEIAQQEHFAAQDRLRDACVAAIRKPD